MAMVRVDGDTPGGPRAWLFSDGVWERVAGVMVESQRGPVEFGVVHQPPPEARIVAAEVTRRYQRPRALQPGERLVMDFEGSGRGFLFQVTAKAPGEFELADLQEVPPDAAKAGWPGADAPDLALEARVLRLIPYLAALLPEWLASMEVEDQGPEDVPELNVGGLVIRPGWEGGYTFHEIREDGFAHQVAWTWAGAPEAAVEAAGILARWTNEGHVEALAGVFADVAVRAGVAP